MPTAIIESLNQPAFALFTPAEVAAFAYSGIQIKANPEDTTIIGMDYNLFCFDVNDFNNILGIQVMIQRNTTLDPLVGGNVLFNPVDLRFYLPEANSDRVYERKHEFTGGIKLEANANHAAWIFILTTGALVNLSILTMTLYGFRGALRQFPYSFR